MGNHQDKTESNSIFDNICELIRGIQEKHKSSTRKPFSSDEIHIAIEAAHAAQLGRPGDLVFQELLEERAITDRKNIKFHLLEDRIKIPKNLNGTVICIGGPRSNVLARVALEYEVELSENDGIYKRILSPTITNHPIEYFASRDTFIRHDLSKYEEIYQDIEDKFPKSKEKLFAGIEHSLPADEEDTFKEPNEERFDKLYRLYCPDRTFKATSKITVKGKPVDLGLTTLQPASFLDFNKTPTDTTLKTGDYLFFDHLTLTIMPNVFSEAIRRNNNNARYGDSLIIYHGLRSLGTVTSLKLLRKDTDHLKDLEVLLRARVDKAERCYQVAWSVFRCPPINASEENKPSIRWEKAFKIDEDKLLEPKSDVEDEIVVPIKTLSGSGFKYHVKDGAIKSLSNEIKPNSLATQSVQKALVKINQIDADQILKAMSLNQNNTQSQNGLNTYQNGLYVLGCFEQSKTLYTQQARAYTLIHALHKAGKISSGESKITIVGGGASGVAATIAAAMIGVNVTLIDEHKNVMSHMENAKHRYIHPYMYDWPRLQKLQNECDLNWLKWEAGMADQVVKRIRELFENARKATLNKHTDQSSIIYINKAKACDYTYNRNAHYQHEIIYHQERNNQIIENKVSSNIVIFATGYGIEEPTEAFLSLLSENLDKEERKSLIQKLKLNEKFDDENKAEEPKLINKSYWDDDKNNFDQACNILETNGAKQISKNKKDRRLIVVSGSGDGALIDILRLCIVNFDHEKLSQKLLDIISHTEEGHHLNEVLDFQQMSPNFDLPNTQEGKDRKIGIRIRKSALILKNVTQSDKYKSLRSKAERLVYLSIAMKEEKVGEIFDLLDLQIRNNLIYNVDLNPQPFNSGASLIHQLLVYALHIRKNVQFYQGKLEINENKNGEPGYKIIEDQNDTETLLDEPVGFVIRHGIGDKPSSFLTDIHGLLSDDKKTTKEDQAIRIFNRGRYLISLLNLTTGLHPETYKFYDYTIRSLR